MLAEAAAADQINVYSGGKQRTQQGPRGTLPDLYYSIYLMRLDFVLVSHSCSSSQNCDVVEVQSQLYIYNN